MSDVRDATTHREVANPREPPVLQKDFPRFDGYQVTSELGSGGMGRVYRALQADTNRVVAIKILHPWLFESIHGRRFFEREVELTAKLSHPHIAAIFESGLHEPPYHYVLEYVDGCPLHRHVAEAGLDRRATLRLMHTVCEAVQYAHEHGIIHRDLKPTNILVDRDGEPRVLDFGLAKTLAHGDDTITVFGDVAGTPAYMSPEQAAGEVDRLDTRTDVYSLGVVLYLLLTGRLPYDDTGGYLQVLRRVREEEPLPPRTAQPSLDRDLDALLSKALARDPRQRYATAGDLARDLESYLIGEPLVARSPSLPYLLRKRVTKHRGPLAIVACTIFALGTVVGYDQGTLRRARDVSETARAELERHHTHAQRRLREMRQRLRDAETALAAARR